MPFLTDKQVKTAEAKAKDFGAATLHLLPPWSDEQGAPRPYADAICTFADRDFIVLIHPDGTWLACEKEWSMK